MLMGADWPKSTVPGYVACDVAMKLVNAAIPPGKAKAAVRHWSGTSSGPLTALANGTAIAG